MRTPKILTTLAATALIAIGAAVALSAQLPGPPVGAPQANQSASIGYNFQYTFTPSATTGYGFRVNPTLNLTTATGQTDYLQDITGTIALPNSSATATTMGGLHLGTLVCTLNSGTATNCANFIADAEPATGTNKYSAWIKGITRFDSTIQSGSGGGAMKLPTTAGSLPSVQDCQSTGTGSQTCTPQAATALGQVVVGKSTLSSNAATITFAPGFTGTTDYMCVANDVTTRANPVQMVPASATTATITNTTGASDVIQWVCAGQ